MSEPWYGDGLSFTCTQCGRCCTGDPGYVWVGDEEVAAIARFLGLEPDEVRERFVRPARGRHSLTERENGDCVFWQTGRGCTIYAARPRQCRSFPFWPEHLRHPEDWEELREECPGAGKGRLYSLSEIRRIQRGEEEASADGVESR